MVKVCTHCTKCGRELPEPYYKARWCKECNLASYYEQKKRPDWAERQQLKNRDRWAGKTPEEKALAVEQRAATKYGLTLEEFRDLRARPCAICGKTDFSGRNDRCIDHDHATGRVRDLLCRNCNSAIGLLGDDPDLIRRAAEYLDHHRATAL